tara:strand:- start:327 stop:497 length:171 start_codon:yes stop_codon:yes gene_type:complete
MREQRQLLQERSVLAPLDGKLIFTYNFRFPTQQHLAYCSAAVPMVDSLRKMQAVKH